MQLFIQIINGQPHEHPIFEDNFRQAFPHVDPDNLPPEFARFERIQAPVPAVFEVVSDVPAYEWVDGIVKDVWTVRPMTESERAAKEQELTQGAYNMRDFFKTLAQQKIDEATTESVRQAWVDYMAQLDAYVVTDPVNPQVPMPPRIDANGNVLTTNSSGTAPDVTG